jgi:hypothetical protein
MIGLKMYREIVLEIYRPLSPHCGVVIASEEEALQAQYKKNPELRPPPCIPRVELPPDVITANYTTADKIASLLALLEGTDDAPKGVGVVQKSKDLLEKAKQRLRDDEDAASIKLEVVRMGLTFDGIGCSSAKVALPFAFLSEYADAPTLYIVATAVDDSTSVRSPVEQE